MSVATQALKYGWVALASLTIGTGTIFVAPVVLNRITLHDRIEVTLAIVERCMATQTGTNSDGTSIYAVAPPSIVRTWTDTNGASVIVTNAFEWRDDLSMKTELDVKLKALCPYYVDTNSVYDGTTNIVMLTFTGLLTSLDLGDHTNFTSIPAIGTNVATFGPWAWRNYVVAWQERYKVLNALRMTKATRKASINGSHLYSFGMVWRTDLIGQHWTNTVTGTTADTYKPYSYADLLGLANGYAYSTNSDWQTYTYDFGEFWHKMTYNEYKQYFTWYWFHGTDSSMGPPPYTPYPDGYVNPTTNETDRGAGDYWAVYKSPYAGGWNPPPVKAWYWNYEFKIDYSTWIFEPSFSGQQITNTPSIYLKPTLASGYWTPASNWQLTAEGRFEELAGLPPNVYSKLDETFVDKTTNTWTVIFGSDEFGPLNAADSQPTFPEAPTEPTLEDLSDFIGTARGLRLEPNDYFFLKDWQFNYCTVKYW